MYDYYDEGTPSGWGFVLSFITIVAVVICLILFLPGCGSDDSGTAKAADTPWPPAGVSHDGNVFYIDPRLDRIISYEDLCKKYFSGEGGDYNTENQVLSIQYPEQTHRGDIVMICHYEAG